MAPTLLLALNTLLISPSADPAAQLAALEARSGGRLGFSALDTATGRRLDHRATERFTVCSTFKVLLAGMVLAQVDTGKLRLDERLPLSKADLVPHAPVCAPRIQEGSMPIADLCAATLQVSDNVAANLLLKRLGGPAALTAWLRSIGDTTTRLDRFEPELNLMAPGDLRDTSTPQAMRESLQRLLTGTVLSEASRQQLQRWMAGATTGLRRLRAGFPSHWTTVDKTGGGQGNNPFNNVAMTLPKNGKPVFVAAYLADAKLDDGGKEQILAEAARIVTAAFGGATPQ